MNKFKKEILIPIAAILLSIGLYIVYATYIQDNRPVVAKPTPVVTLSPTPSPTPIPTPTQKPMVLESPAPAITNPVVTPRPTPTPKVINPKFHALLERNKDVIGWITIDDTKIDYEVLYDGTDYYLNHTIDHVETVAGSIYMDQTNNIERNNYNMLLHGHHMKNGTMFKDVVKFKERDFFMKHRIIKFDTLYHDMVWEVFSVYVLDANKEMMYTNFAAKEDFLAMANSFKDRSMFQIEGLELNGNDRLLTLSTCSYEVNNARTILHARLIQKDGVMVAEPTSDWLPDES